MLCRNPNRVSQNQHAVGDGLQQRRAVLTMTTAGRQRNRHSRRHGVSGAQRLGGGPPLVRAPGRARTGLNAEVHDGDAWSSRTPAHAHMPSSWATLGERRSRSQQATPPASSASLYQNEVANGTAESVVDWNGEGGDSNPRYGCPHTGFRNQSTCDITHGTSVVYVDGHTAVARMSHATPEIRPP